MSTTKEIMKAYFEAGNVPAQNHFTVLIDSFKHVDEQETIKSFAINSKGDLTINLASDKKIQIEEFILPSSMPISFVDSLQKMIANNTTLKELNDVVAISNYGIKYTWATQEEREAQTGMGQLEQGLQKNTNEVYQYTGSKWELIYNLEIDHKHDDRYYTQEQTAERFLEKNEKAVDSNKLDGLDSTDFSRTNHDHSWSEIKDVPTSFPASNHNHNDLYYTETESNARFLGKTAKATNSAQLDGKESSYFVALTNIVDDLTSTAENKPLSANQGKVLKGLIDDINAILSSDDTKLDEIQEIVNYIKQNKSELENLGISSISGLSAALSNKENAFSKNTAFNKDFGTTAGTVSAGNHQHKWSEIKEVPTTFPAATHNHNDLYYTETESNARFLGKTAKAADSDKLDGLDSSAFLQDISNSSNGVTVLTPKDAAFSTSSSSVKGAIKIDLPVGWSNTMMKLHVDIFDYTNNESISLILSGYNYQSKSWYNTSAQILGSSISRNFTVRFGHEEEKPCIYIGEITSTWAYLKTVITKGIFGYSNFQKEKWLTGWGISLVEAFGTIQRTHTETLVTASNSMKLEGLDSAAFAKASHNHNDLYYTEAESNARFLGKTAKAADSDKLDGLDSSAFAKTSHSHNDLYYTESESNARFLGKTAKATDSDKLDGLDSSAFAKTSHSHNDLYYTEAESNARFLGKTAKAIDSDKLDGIDSTAFARQEIIPTRTLKKGWYTIAVNSGNRASAKFILAGAKSGSHQAVHFYGAHHYGVGNVITVLSNSFYSGKNFDGIRIKEGGVYNGAMLQVHIEADDSVVSGLILEDFQTSGWLVKNWVPDGTDPGNVSSFELLTNIAAEISLSKTRGVNSSEEIFVKDSKVLKEGEDIILTDKELKWLENTDGAAIGFKNESDADTDSYLYFKTSDNKNEYFKWIHTSGGDNEWMQLKQGGLKVLGNIHSNNKIVATQEWANGAFLGKTAKASDSDKLDGYNSASTVTANTVPVRDGAADVHARLFRSNYQTQGSIPAGATVTMRISTTDNYLRHVTKAGFSAWLGKVNDSDKLDGLDGAQYNHKLYNVKNYLGAGYISGGLEKPDWFGSGRLQLQMLRNTNVGGSNTWNDVLWLSSYTGGDVKKSNALIFGKSTPSVGFTQQNYDATTWGKYYEFFHTGNQGAGSGLDADKLDGVQGAQLLRSDVDDTFTGKLSVGSTNTRQAGIYGVYDSKKIGHIWSMGTAYKIAADGTDFGNLYGFAYKHTNNTTGGAMAGGHQAIWCENGVPKVALGNSGVWTSGKIAATGTVSGSDIYASGTYYYGDNKRIIQFSDSWLRFNPGNNFTSGIYCGTSTLRTDKRLEVGSSGSAFYADDKGNGRFKANLTVGNQLTVSGAVLATGDVVAFSSSDKNLKDNIKKIESPLSKIDKLSGNEFIWNDKQTAHKEGSKDYGVIAQEVADVLPEAVRKNENTGYLSVRYEKLIPLLIEGMKEQQQQIEELKTKLYGTTN
ncbi:tail fiber domain-containing protein [Tenacibaculum sp. M341]|uniref:tail fiber domain-containing protein n=1 Tax=Tenacibaculum sp. M341 TaxID=2530339 RepID=UPI00104D08EF|nr:tail fiber domain-containing protein [Tenacibaculum sp. M341]TCI93195.1 hypothetical protein EYW44_06150 [Tenacibaculum sp. M341]